ncbi:EamA family transporter [Rhizobium rhizosphaerae]|uniref:EamA family transporter n=2 Tax=Xaviernesmea rhizosphaerae TaxID=1672749 RepID=A0ABX3PJR2_9HYPH|nr:DMT family transporter [Xaviernesmea rhizosphaerae]OQP88484.1 EamA family transporter [Xaviernesmea rhizosphaerae]
MKAASSDRHRGLAITGLGGLALSFDIPLMRSADGAFWPVLAARSLSMLVAALIIWLVLNRVLGRAQPLLPGRAGLLAALLYGLGSVFFVASLFHTASANVVFLLAFTSMFSALIAWIFLKERPAPATLVTMAVMLAGVALIVGGGFEGGHLTGDLMAVASALSIAGAITLGRASMRPMGLVPLVSAALPAGLALAMMGDGWAIEAPQWVLLDGFVLLPLAFFCLATGPRYLSAPEVGMFYLLETVLAPVWIWLIFAEAPTGRTLAGGAILILALFAHALWQMRRPQAVEAGLR